MHSGAFLWVNPRVSVCTCVCNRMSECALVYVFACASWCWGVHLDVYSREYPGDGVCTCVCICECIRMSACALACVSVCALAVCLPLHSRVWLLACAFLCPIKCAFMCARFPTCKKLLVHSQVQLHACPNGRAFPLVYLNLGALPGAFSHLNI